MIRAMAIFCLVALAACQGGSDAALSSKGACTVAVPRADEVVPNDGSHDAAALSEAVRAAVNRERCARGLGPVAADAALYRAAAGHSAAMARLNFFDHTSPVAGQRTLGDRARAVGLANVALGENIITGSFMYNPGQHAYFTQDAAACRFTSARTGAVIPRQTYRSLGDELVARWMDSPGHRRNILDPEYRRHGFAMAPDPSDRAFCGGLYGTQMFAG